MKKIKKIYTSLIIFCFCAVFLNALQGLSDENYTTSPSPLHEEIDLYLKKSDFQGAVLIAKEGKILFKKGYGLSNREHDISNTLNTVFRIGSITKLFTAIAILQLQEMGKLNVNDPIIKYLPAYPQHQGEKVTIHHLLSHTSGIPSITELPNILEIQRQASFPQQTMKYFNQLQFNFPPGTDCEYSDSGFIILGAIIEAITKKSYAEYLQELIFRPLSMDSTYFDYNHLIIPNRAEGYVKNKNGEMEHPPYVDLSFPHGSGALASTVEDLYRLDRALKEGSILKKESLATLFTLQAKNFKRLIAYGYGIRIGSQNKGMEGCESSIVGHFGTIEGFEAALIRYRDVDLSIILLSNVEKTGVRFIHKKLAEIIRSK